MERKAGIDAAGISHDIIGKGMERKKILRKDTDQVNFISFRA